MRRGGGGGKGAVTAAIVRAARGACPHQGEYKPNQPLAPAHQAQAAIEREALHNPCMQISTSPASITPMPVFSGRVNDSLSMRRDTR